MCCLGPALRLAGSRCRSPGFAAAAQPKDIGLPTTAYYAKDEIREVRVACSMCLRCSPNFSTEQLAREYLRMRAGGLQRICSLLRLLP